MAASPASRGATSPSLHSPTIGRTSPTRTRVFEGSPDLQASAIIFTEALVHGTLPWRGNDERRTVFYKYSPRPLAWSRTLYDPAEYPDLTERQRDILRSPGIEHV